MITLDSTTKKLQVVLAGNVTTNQLVVNVVWTDENIEGVDTKYASKQSVTNQTTDVDICDAPQQNFTRNIETITVYNADTVAATITVKIDNGGTETILFKQALNAGETFLLEHGAGAQVL